MCDYTHILRLKGIVSSDQLIGVYIIGNYVKRTIEEMYTANEVTPCTESINKVHLPYYFFFSII